MTTVGLAFAAVPGRKARRVSKESRALLAHRANRVLPALTERVALLERRA